MIIFQFFLSFFEKIFICDVVETCVVSVCMILFFTSLNNLFILQNFSLGYKKQTMLFPPRWLFFFSKNVYFHIKKFTYSFILGEGGEKKFTLFLYSWLNSRKRVILFLKGFSFLMSIRREGAWLRKRLTNKKSSLDWQSEVSKSWCSNIHW